MFEVRFARVAVSLLIRSIGCALIAGGAGAQYNTLIIVADDLGVDAIATYREGSTPPPTPNLDALAANGVLFRNAYANPLCSPTRATMMTGRYGYRTSVGEVGGTLPRGEVTLPEVLDAGNIAHALIGKWHLGGGTTGPNDAGWSHFSGSINGMLPNSSYSRWTKVVNGRRSQTTVYPTTDQVNDAISWIQAQTRPWVVSLNFLAPHEPFHAPPSNLHTYNLTGQNPATNPISFYKAAVEAIDTEIGRLLQTLGSATLAKTNIIFVGDNGTPRRVIEAPFNRQRGKGSIYEGGVNVPLIVSGPAVQSPGREVSALVHTVDLFHTAAELSGLNARSIVPSSVVLDGVSIVPYLVSAQRTALREFMYAERFNGQTLDDQCVRNDTYKMIRRNGAADELYDLPADAFEQRDLLNGPLTQTQQENRDRLSAQLDVARGRAAHFPFGNGCGGVAGAPTLAALNAQRPVTGSTFTVRVANLAPVATAVIGVFGLSRSDWAGVSLPLPLDNVGMPGCILYVRPDAIFPTPINAGAAQWTLPVPNLPALLGLRFFQQAVVFEPGANTAGAIITNAAEGLIEAR